MTARERAPTVREADMAVMRRLVTDHSNPSLGWEYAWKDLQGVLPPSISREDVRRFVIPRLTK